MEYIQALTAPYIINKDRDIITTIDGSIQSDIVVNSDDKEAITDSNILDEEREAKREMYFRHARVLYPDKEEWCISSAVDAFMIQQDKGIDITTHSFS